MQKIAIFNILVIFTLSCSKSTPYVESTVVKQVVERTWDESKASSEIANSKDFNNALIEVESFHAQKFNWSFFWNELGKDVLKIENENIYKLSNLSIIKCSIENSNAYISFLNNAHQINNFSINTYITAVNNHLLKCAEFYSLPMHRSVEQRMIKAKENLLDTHYGNYIDLLFRKSEIIATFDTNDVINEDLLKRGLNKSFKENELATFITLSGVFRSVYPEKDLAAELSLGNTKISLEKLSLIADKNSLRNTTHILKILPKESYISNNSDFNKLSNILGTHYLRKTSQNIGPQSLNLKLEDYVANANEILYFLTRLAHTNEDKRNVLELANNTIKNIVKNYDHHVVESYLKNQSLNSLFSTYLKKIYIKDIELDLNLNVVELNFFDRVNFYLLKIKNEKKQIKRKNILDKLCIEFSNLSLNNLFSSIEQDGYIGCSDINKNFKSEKDYILSFYGVYRYLSQGDLIVEAQGLKGGLFDLSNQLEHNKRAKISVGKKHDGIVIPYLFKIKLKEGVDTEVIMPYIFRYQDKDSIQFSWENYEVAKKGYGAGNLILKLDNFSEIMPELIATGGLGQDGLKRPLKESDSEFEFDLEHLELNLPFSATVLDSNFRSNRNMNIAFENSSEDKYFSLTQDNTLDLLPNFQRKEVLENLKYINQIEEFGCIETDVDCIYLKLYPIIIGDIAMIFKKNYKEVDSHEKFNLSKKALGLGVEEDQVPGLRGDNGSLIIK